MNFFTLLGIGVAFVIFLVGLVLALWAYRATRQKNMDAAQRQRAVVEDLGDKVLWEMGKGRPIIQTKNFDLKIGKRTFVRKVALGILVSSAGWLAARGENFLLAEKLITPSKKRNLKSRSWKSNSGDDRTHTDQAHTDTTTHNDETIAHTDTHSDASPHSDGAHYDDPGKHNDVDHTDTQPHADGDDDQGHIDTPYGTHSDVDHVDTQPVPHSDLHNDNYPHTDDHSDTTHSDTFPHTDV